MRIKVIGTIYEVLPPRSGTGKNGYWESQDIVIKTGETPYGDEFVVVSMFGDKIMMNPKVGEFVKLECNLKAQKTGEKWFTNLNLWRWEQTAPALTDNKVEILSKSNAEVLDFEETLRTPLPEFSKMRNLSTPIEEEETDLPF